MERHFVENFDRLCGLHRLRASLASDLVGVKPVTVSTWRQGTRSPSTDTLVRLAEFFEVDAVALMSRPFGELLPALADSERFERVEHKIRAAKGTLRPVQMELPATAKGRQRKAGSEDSSG